MRILALTLLLAACSKDSPPKAAQPAQPGAYDIRTNIGQNNSCGTTTSWWASSPGDGRTIARVCVH